MYYCYLICLKYEKIIDVEEDAIDAIEVEKQVHLLVFNRDYLVLT